MQLKVFQVDAFTSSLFKGNPAAVVILEKEIPYELMQNIAFENNLSETAYILINKSPIEIRWFSMRFRATIGYDRRWAQRRQLANSEAWLTFATFAN